MISERPPGSDWPATLSVPIWTSASSDGRSRSAIDAVRETLPLLDAPGLAAACTLMVPVKELAPPVVFAASCTASSALAGAAVLAPDPVAPAPEPAPAQPARAAARIAVTPAAQNGDRVVRARIRKPPQSGLVTRPRGT